MFGQSQICFDANGDAIDCGAPGAVTTFTLTPAQQAAAAAANVPDVSIYDIQYGGAAGGPASYEAAPPGTVPYSGSTVSSRPVSLPPGPAPRVSVKIPPAFTQSSVIKGVPDILLYGGGALLLLGVLGGGGRRRRR
jgi:hypothetical protein